MTETRSYELTPEQVLEICQALKFHADALKQATSLWQLIDKLVGETPSLRLRSLRGDLWD
jgi:hypothetical protein